MSEKKDGLFKDFGVTCKEALMSGIGYMIPVVIGGAIIQAIASLLTGANPVDGTFLGEMYTWGNSLFNCLNYVLAMYTAYKIGNRAALAPGLLVGLFAAGTSAGFLGSVIGGIICGYLVKWLNKVIKLPASFASAKGLVIIPVVSCFVMFVVMDYALCPVFTQLITWLTSLIQACENLSPFIFGGVCATLVAVGMGSFPGWAVFAVAMIVLENTGSYQVFTAMTCGGACCCLGIAIAILVAPKKFTEEERGGVVSLFAGWICCVTEMEIPYALRDPKTFYPAIAAGAFVGGGLVMTLGVEVPAMHGGMIVAALANNLPLWIVCILATAIVTAVLVIVLKKAPKKDAE